MIIEFVDLVDTAELGDATKAIFLHIDQPEDKPPWVEKTKKGLCKAFPKYTLVDIVNGKPCPANPLPKIAVFNQENKPLLSAIRKTCKRGKPGSFVSLEADEMAALVKAQSSGELLYF